MTPVNTMLPVERVRSSRGQSSAHPRSPAHPTGESSSRRRSKRMYQRIAATLRMDSEGQAVECPATIMDLSQHGVRVLTCESFRPGQTLKIDFSYKGKTYPLRVRVVWVCAELGLEFLD